MFPDYSQLAAVSLTATCESSRQQGIQYGGTGPRSRDLYKRASMEPIYYNLTYEWEILQGDI